jgi:hypothetical protein
VCGGEGERQTKGVCVWRGRGETDEGSVCVEGKGRDRRRECVYAGGSWRENVRRVVICVYV